MQRETLNRMAFLRLVYVIGFVIVIAMILQGCGGFNSHQSRRQFSPNVIRGLWEGKSATGREFTLMTVEGLKSEGQALVDGAPEDAESFCLGYRSFDMNGRLAFWVGLISAIAKFESDFKPELTFKEKFSDSKGAKVVSRGLLQLSFESAQDWGCKIEQPDDLHDPRRNLLCGIRILNQLIESVSVISGRETSGDESKWLGGARYWSVLREGRRLDEIKAAMSTLEVCRL